MPASISRPKAQNLPDYAVETRLLSKTYRARGRQEAKLALDSVSLTIPRGSFFGLLGPNGAGKSTLINILAGLVVKSSGHAYVWGYDTVDDERMARAAIGVVPQELNLDPFFTPREMLEVQAGLYGVPAAERRTDEILEAVGLADKAHAYARTLSGGMRRRLLVAKAMVHNPPVLVLDEPTAGVDIQLRQQLWAYVKGLNDAGTTILLTTHYLEEAEELCDRIAIIDQGKVVADEETQALLHRLDSKMLTVVVDRDLEETPPVLAAFNPELKNRRRLTFRFKPSRIKIGAILAAFDTAGLSIIDLITEEADLEDIFLRLTRHDPIAAPPSARLS
ncbi:ABC transporter ATP-binding protein [Telmatospirillum sp.]|uniref:ABC transporter ATP-binding protein n=1 Tax=Telmatospirillum sp. TaxID=2079197 RepID=UPI00283AD053|nr:ABC transporter ATP-binding protein [Telmatospirillum sp.]MDR3436814.1 ABC transporter ATP-binding protein [Telmatospirillum sp.]